MRWPWMQIGKRPLIKAVSATRLNCSDKSAMYWNAWPIKKGAVCYGKRRLSYGGTSCHVLHGRGYNHGSARNVLCTRSRDGEAV